MMNKPTELGGSWWAKNLDDVDREIARLASLCRVRVLDPGVIERVLENDASVCGAANPIGFEKLRAALLTQYNLRDRAVEALGEAKKALLVREIVASLRKKFGDQLGKPKRE